MHILRMILWPEVVLYLYW